MKKHVAFLLSFFLIFASLFGQQFGLPCLNEKENELLSELVTLFEKKMTSFVKNESDDKYSLFMKLHGNGHLKNEFFAIPNIQLIDYEKKFQIAAF
jgi:hypothetical protein